jgi:hypothetical protein
MTSRNRWLKPGAIALLMLILVSLVFAPGSANLRSGSTYSRAPSGYGAWYAYMQSQNHNIQRWQRPIADLPNWNSPGNVPEAVPILDRSILDTQSPPPNPQSLTPITLLQIDNGLEQLTFSQWQWIEQGNVLIQLGRASALQFFGLETPVTAAPFTSTVSSLMGDVKIATSRRLLRASEPTPDTTEAIDRLFDQYGAIVWQQSIGQGRWIVAVTPHLAANAYQNEPGNFQFLEQLVIESGNPIWVDEFLHGYRDQDETTDAANPTIFSYFARTPLPLIAMQAIVILAVLIWGQNRRFGPPLPLATPAPDNSKAYTQALAAVLQKANCHEFVINTICEAEQRHLQRSLGLAEELEPEAVIAAWVQQTGRSAAELEPLFTPPTYQRFSDRDLVVWLKNLQTLRQPQP